MRLFNSSTRRKVLLTCAGLFVFSQILFLINIQFPRGPNFDEFHYIPSAKQFLQLKQNQNWEHPPLAKELMAVGIAIWGDRPIGWRFMSTLFGSLTLVGMYLWALAIFRNHRIALWAALLTLVNQLLYVQARIGMLDTFMFAFIVWGMAAFTATWEPALAEASSGGFSRSKSVPLASGEDPALMQSLSPEQNRKLLYAAGILLGLATACKWFGVIAWALCVGWVILIRMVQNWRTTFADPRAEDWYSSTLWKDIRAKDWVLSLGVAFLAAYFITFIPFLFINAPDYGFFQIFTTMQWKMWDGQGRVVNSHPYMSTWTQWATLARPIWYAFDKEGPNGELVRGVILLGNPWIMWTGLLALVACAWGWMVERRRDAFLVLSTFVAFYFSWAVIPRKVAFFYYYYPAGMVLSFALAYVFHQGERAFGWKTPWARWAFLAVALGFFIYFFPISAALQIPADSFRKWMWRTSWI